MKVAVVLALVCLHLSSAVTPDQALQEEWKVGLQLYILHAKQTIVESLYWIFEKYLIGI